VFEVTLLTTSVWEFAGGITRGLVRDRVLVSVILRDEFVALRSVQNDPPSAIAVEDGRVSALNPELVR
jgi:hypothetical protein